MAPTEAGVKRTAEETQTSAVKRVRFANTASSNEVTSLAIVEAQKLEWFSPKFTYHAFGADEAVDGYEGLKMMVTFNGFDFRALLDVKFKEKEDTAGDVVAKLTSSLPKGFVQDKGEFVGALRKAATDFTGPPGKCIESYCLKSQIEDFAEERHFEIYECKLEDNEPAQKLLANLQTLSLWFIEGADAVDVTDPRWLAYLIYERTEAGAGAFRPVGFITVFKFFNPLGRKAAYCKPDQNETHRICQALIFPTYQRQGHAERLVQCIHAQAVANEHVYELTVEDPVPAFASLRDLVDLKNCIKNEFFSLSPEASADAGGTGRGTEALTTADIHTVQEKLKITQKQVQTCYETRKFALVDPSDEAQLKKFRLEVKKRLFRLHTEELDGMGADRRKAFLEAEYQKLEEHYRQMAIKNGLMNINQS
ncbi:histone acetyltransferase, putative [Phytophthora infestans T30-4]|uniref:histone acetyltransferase n=1 Tax=Phytophthora infestans (strain T30-4) TaxID=403677 RepID=D0MQ56_PHYIT|nr:histone acetyltransferase, putative [Phytophthora infestans T30-4]EEY57625.1 histone acetyltransferase, putative [Phytophthora infestans T30-4]|eukprot:XP_002908811.1 histone acetyltransferase, putative [Phytophthora infestans T30-4]